jgi:hypothetical protein
MKKLTLLVLIAALAYAAHQKANRPDQFVASDAPDTEAMDVEMDNTKFRCDGRTHCSQMTSCEEATYFLQNCPGVKMDGEGDGVPCEKQWCGRQ